MMICRTILSGLGLSLALMTGAIAQGAAAPPPFVPDMSPGLPPAQQNGGFGPAPQAGPPRMQAAPPQMQAGPPGQPPCMADFAPLRDEAQKRAGLIKVAADRKADRKEICNLITRFSEAEGKFAKYMETNQSWCGIPPHVVTQVKAQHVKTMKTRTQVCSTAGPMGPQGPTLPQGPGLSDVLSTGRAPTADNTSKGKGGTFDTLSGNAIK